MSFDLSTWTRDFDKWLGQDNAGPWSFGRLTDAQKESVMWVGISVVMLASFWKGIPFGWSWKEIYVKDDNDEYVLDDKDKRKTTMKLFLRWFAVLGPVKYQTVLYHEVCHAIVGRITGGHPILIIVNFNEGGACFFDPRKKQPNAIATLAAGYAGSCFLGCVFLILGFDALASKCGFLLFEVLALISVVTCLVILPKSFVSHHWHGIRKRVAKLRGDHRRAAEHEQSERLQATKNRKDANWKEEDHVGNILATDKDKMVSIEVILAVNAFVGALVTLAWYLSDSLYLRFIILSLGTMNALYAIWDVYLDGVKYGKVLSSDITELAKEYNEKRIGQGKKRRPQGYYAGIWLTIQTTIVISSVLVALYVWRGTIAEQALDSRKLLASPNHYSPADLLDQARNKASGLYDDISDEF